MSFVASKASTTTRCAGIDCRKPIKVELDIFFFLGCCLSLRNWCLGPSGSASALVTVSASISSAAEASSARMAAGIALRRGMASAVVPPAPRATLAIARRLTAIGGVRGLAARAAGLRLSPALLALPPALAWGVAGSTVVAESATYADAGAETCGALSCCDDAG